ncbi:hypothetical protein CRE_02245 [Caenorhabditis remanei]|uniref:Uncharacterized protein n=1 Tax=Caenorhabditis remanei TaxID=31234 RepID=E3LFU9_CAERE|nr:hypothetical protein CRE_02245 [Caenorhabditis remanei]
MKRNGINWNKEKERFSRYTSKRKRREMWDKAQKQSEEDTSDSGMEHFREACDNSSESYFDFDDGVFNTSYDETEAGSSTSENFDRRNAIDVISAVFLYNNVSRTFAQDIFTIAELLRDYSSISLSEIYRTIETWSNRENRCYTSCGACQKLLKQSKICTNRECSRYLRTQTNMAGCTRIITFSLKEQLLGILESGNYDKDLLNRDNWTSSLSAKLSRTPKYRDRLEKANREHPGVITMFLTLNMDGFRKRGLARGEFWPLYVAANDLTEERSKFSEYRPEVVMISSLIQTSKQIESGDFNAAFERMRCEVEETQRYPIEVTIDGVPHKIRLEIFQTVLDMDASRKIHGLPVWQSYNSCSRCSIKGQRIETKKGTKIVWLPEENDEQYSCLNIPTKLKTSCLPFPWKEGFDSLHLVNEGTSRDILKDLLKGGEKYNVKIQSENNLKWVNCLSKAKNPKGVSSTILLDPIQLTTRTGSEVQQLFNVAVPMLVVVHNKCDIWLICLYLQWITTRLVVDPNLSSKHCDALLEIVPVLRDILKNHFPQFYSMKQHVNIQELSIVIYFCFQFVLDHMVPQLKYDGSPLLSSAAPFERLNQVLGRGTGAHTTRTLLNMCRRFIALQKAVSHCNVAIAKPDSPITFPKSMKSVDDEDLIHNTKLDGVPLTTHEKMYLRSHSIDITECSQVFTNNLENFRISTISNQKVYSTRRNCDDNVQHNCYIYFLDQQNSIQFGSIERIFTLDGRCVVLIHKFQLADPFPYVRKYVEDMPELKRVFQLSERSNTYFKQIVGIDLVVVEADRIGGFCTVVEFESRSYLSRC